MWKPKIIELLNLYCPPEQTKMTQTRVKTELKSV